MCSEWRLDEQLGRMRESLDKHERGICIRKFVNNLDY